MERSEAVKTAQEHMVAILSGERSPFEGALPNDLANSLNDLTTARDNYERAATAAIRDLESSLPFVRGEAARWNSLGNVQSNLDLYAAVFSARADVAKRDLVNHYLAQ